MRVTDRTYDRDDFCYNTTVEVSSETELGAVIKAIAKVTSLKQFQVHLVHQQLLICYTDPRAMINPKAREHEVELTIAMKAILRD